ncbi:unnamed protein product [Calicophoron daubneyi]|uniref:EGF-like domain-containing protein n=1 Tax=Calicophoron daubneyi TaxID=300641 RepID=A0AAV2SWA3_CALDB
MKMGIHISEHWRRLFATMVMVAHAILAGTDAQSSELDPLNLNGSNQWEPMKIFEYKFVYGFPADFIGSDIGTFYMTSASIKESSKKPSPVNKTESQNEKQGNNSFKYSSPIFEYNPKSEEELYSNTGNTNSPTNLEIYPFTDQSFYSTSTVDKARDYFTRCANEKEKLLVRFGGMVLCNYRDFYKILDGPLPEHYYGWTRDSVTKTQLYVYWFCRVTVPKLQEKDKEAARVFCPNPCSVKISRCSLTENTVTAIMSPKLLYSISESNCVKENDGFFEGDYKCICREGYTWKPSNKACSPTDACAMDGQRDPCDPEGTLHCVSFVPPTIEDESTAQRETLAIKMKAHYHCVCRPGYMGYRCERPRDACIESGLITQGSGEQACRTFLGNQCIPHPGTDHYSCKCFGIWMHDNRYPFPNCYQRRQICDRILCHNRGTCRSSVDQTTFDCQCEYGWSGKLCEKPDVRQWMPWGRWTTCSAPVCAGQGWQSRTRKCRVPVNKVTGLGRCVGNTVEFRPCRSGCVDAIQIYTPIVKIILYFAVCLVMLQFAAGLIYALLQMEFSR